MTNKQNDSSLAMVFPGQGSQSIGMLHELHEQFPLVADTFAEASTVLGYDLWALVKDGPVEQLNQTDRTQPAMLTAGVAVWRVWREQGGAMPAMLAGHSLGEYTALVCAEALDFKAAVGLVEARGQLMQAAVPEGIGAMAAILGLDDAQVLEVCAQAAADEVVAPVNFNSPGQVVIAGHAAAVSRAMELAKAAGAKRALPLPVSVPSHCSLMKPAAERFAQRLQQVEIAAPAVPVLHNADVQAYDNAAAIRDALSRQLYSPVRWVDTIRHLHAAGLTRLLECGPGKVLVGLNKRIEKSMQAEAVYDPATLAAALAARA